MKIVNLTPHPLNMKTDSGDVIIQPSGTVARATTTRNIISNVNVDGINIPINKTVFGDVDGLPDPQPDTIFIVSMLVANAVQRPDVLIVDDTVRDDQGRIVGAKAFATVVWLFLFHRYIFCSHIDI